MVIAYIEGAASMAHMFPKLRIIRGNNLVKHYALIVAFTEFDTVSIQRLRQLVKSIDPASDSDIWKSNNA